MGIRSSKKLMPSFVKPLIIVLGATGAGKSKLALEVAAQLNGEIISMDSMQIYKGLDIVTNKVTTEEQEMCPHHMIGFLSPLEEYTITEYQNCTLDIIADIHARNKIPILVGGTNYYVESILWDYLVKTKQLESGENLALIDQSYRQQLEAYPPERLYEMLCNVDPYASQRFHPGDKRKMIRALEVHHITGKPISEHWKEQLSQNQNADRGGPLRFKNACLLWVQCDPEILEERVYKRVDKMIKQGLVKELLDFHESYNKQRLSEGSQPDYERGIFQSIGFKEFHEYLTASEDVDISEKQRLFDNAVERMKIQTWKYAKYQVKCIKNRIVHRKNGLPVFPLDASDPSSWQSQVLTPALQVLKHFYRDHDDVVTTLCDVNVIENDLVQPIEKTDRPKFFGFQHCVECNKYINNHMWNVHLKTRRHRALVFKRQRELTNTRRILTAHIAKLAAARNNSGKGASDQAPDAEDPDSCDVFGTLFDSDCDKKSESDVS